MLAGPSIHEQLFGTTLSGLDIFKLLRAEFENPATLLWRTIELTAAGRVVRAIRLGKPILDLGCAEGVITSVMFRNEAAIIGIDPWYEALKQASLRSRVGVRIQADGCALPFRSASVSAVFSNSVIEHIADVDAVVNEVRRVLVRDGVFVFTVPVAQLSEEYFPAWLLARTPIRTLGVWYAHLRNTLLEHHNLLSRSSWERTLAKSGLTLDIFEPYLDSPCTRVWDILAAMGWALRVFQRHALGRRMGRWVLERWLYPYVCRLVEAATDPRRLTSTTGSCAVIVARCARID